MKIFRNGFWQKFLTILVILLDLGFLIALIALLGLGALNTTYVLLVLFLFWLLNFTVLVFIMNNNASSLDYNAAWLFFVGCLPLIGAVIYILFAHKMRTKSQSKFLSKYYSIIKADPNDSYVEEKIKRDYPSSYRIMKYAERASECHAYENTSVEYFPLGDEVLDVMLREVKKAHHYIFIEYFIIKPGKMWNSILEVLKEKVKEGVDVRVVYDDVGNLGATPVHYDQVLRSYGIKARIFNKIRPMVDIRVNNRDHRKIFVIDGHTCFTGGINLADEYINQEVRFGHWKDNCIMIKGKAVYGFTLLFLSAWISYYDSKATISYNYYKPETFIDEDNGFPRSDGYVQAYADVPYSDYSCGLGVYTSLLGNAKNYVYISTPYLIPDEKIKNALKMAALSGVDVRIITPHIPDKKAVFMLTRKNYGQLLKAGVKIYEYTPGFIHQKMFVADDNVATIGTMNLDYRSLFLHMENGTLLIGNSSIQSMKQDFLNTIEVSEEITMEKWKKMRNKYGFFWYLLNLFAPLL